jgi:hypothetical protein
MSRYPRPVRSSRPTHHSEEFRIHQSEASERFKKFPSSGFGIEIGSIRLRNHSGVYLLCPEESDSFLNGFGQLSRDGSDKQGA